MSGTSWETGQYPPPELVERLMRDARQMRSQAIAAMFASAGHAIRAGLRSWFHGQPPTRLAGTLSGRPR